MKSVDEIPFVSFSVKVWKIMGFLYSPGFNIQRYFCLSINIVLNIFQFAYLCTEKKLDKLILNGYFTVLYFNSIIRVFVVLKNQKKFENCIQKLTNLYNNIEMHGDDYTVNILQSIGSRAYKFSIINHCLAITTGTSFLIYPVFTKMADLPYGLYIPGLNVTDRSTYYALFAYEVLVTPPGASLYIPFSNLFISFLLFYIVLIRILRYHIDNIMQHDEDTEQDERIVMKKLKIAIRYHQNLITFVDEFNSLVTNVCFIELIFFVMLLCALLFVLNIVELFPQICLSCLYIVLIMTQLYTVYWSANELTYESLKIHQTLYNCQWYNMSEKCKNLLIIFMIRASRPLEISAGNIYPLTLQMFQSLLNVSYSYFTVLRRIY
ncbi:odorant receptor Or2-like [Lutzomyia longipalpis]|uniref:odorant receptor Or2-like n=1 Tax=Lutzomyia longipalpis TaxID=7200 RepID=UPI002483A978|nr:odorant receptor Or2-like [Lutzomyia longipalpis]